MAGFEGGRKASHGPRTRRARATAVLITKRMGGKRYSGAVRQNFLSSLLLGRPAAERRRCDERSNDDGGSCLTRRTKTEQNGQSF
jgi:hypothetical protein